MVSAAIPEFRLSPEAIRKDIQRILDSGIRLHEHFKVTPENFRTIRESHDAVFIAVGAQDSVKLRLDGMDAEGVLDPLDFLFNLRSHTPLSIGNKVVIIGGGNTRWMLSEGRPTVSLAKMGR
jgi:putative selenate reductase